MMEIFSVKYKYDSIIVELSTGENLRLPVELEINVLVKKNKELDEESYFFLKKKSQIFLCQQKALYYLSLRNRSKQEMRNYLIKKEFQNDVIEEIIEKLVAQNLLNDEDFARKYVDYLKRRKIVGENYLRNKLYEKGISKEIITLVLKEKEDWFLELENCYELAQVKHKKIVKKDHKYQKIVMFLQYRGFKGDTVCKTMKKLKSEGFDLE